MVAPSIATSRQPPSASPIARPGPASWVAPESLVASAPAPGGSGAGDGGGGNTGGLGGGGGEDGGEGGSEGKGGGAHVHEIIPLVQLVLGLGSGHW